MQMARQGSARQQVNAPLAQLAHTRTGQRKPQPPQLDEPMHLVEQLRHTLEFVHHNPALVPLRDLIAEPLWRSQQLRVRLVVEQIEK
jgi:hypothetical protein